MSRITVFDDNEAFLELIADYAELCNIEITCFKKWDDQLLEDKSFSDSLLFLDLHMPEKDGMDILCALADNHYRGQVVLMSGMDELVLKSAEKFALQSKIPIFNILCKPFTLDAFKTIIHQFKSNAECAKTATPIPSESPIEFDDQLFEQALSENWFYPVYQPQIDIETKKCSGIECLSRLKTPSNKIIPPSIFIPQLESLGLIEQFSLYMFELAIKEVLTLWVKGYQFFLSLNISALSLNKEFCTKLVQLSDKYQIDRTKVIIEITESSVIDLSPDSHYAVSKLRILGFQLSVDDFGTGHNSINHISELPFNEIKIDRSFVSDIGSPTVNTIVKSTIQLARSLNYRIVAEGVETSEQLSYLQEMDCSCIQGYLFSKPLDFSDLREYLYSTEHTDNIQKVVQNSPIDDIDLTSSVFLVTDASSKAQQYSSRLKNHFKEKIVHLKNEDIPEDIIEQLLYCGELNAESFNRINKLPHKQLFAVTQAIDIITLEKSLSANATDLFDYSISPKELVQRINKHFEYRTAIKKSEDEINYGREITFNTMREASMYGAQLHLIRDLISVCNESELFEIVFAYFIENNYTCAIQLRDGSNYHTKLSNKAECPLIISEIFETTRKQKRLFQFRNRLICNGKDVSILYLNTPEDEVQLGQLKDVAATIVDVLEEKWQELKRHSALKVIAEKSAKVSNEIYSAVHTMNEQAARSIGGFSDDLHQSFHILDLNEDQENHLIFLLTKNMNPEANERMLSHLCSLTNELEAISLAHVNIDKNNDDDSRPIA